MSRLPFMYIKSSDHLVLIKCRLPERFLAIAYWEGDNLYGFSIKLLSLGVEVVVDLLGHVGMTLILAK